MDHITRFAKELAELGFRQDHLEMRFPRGGQETGYITVHRLNGGYRITLNSGGSRMSVTAREPTIRSVLGLLPDWLRDKVEEWEVRSPAPVGARDSKR